MLLPKLDGWLACLLLMPLLFATETARGQTPSPAAPTLRLARGEDGKVTLAFTPVAEATSYAITVEPDDGQRTILEPVAVPDYTVHGLVNGRDYRFSVAAVVAGRRGPWSNTLSARPVDQPGWATLREAFTSTNPTRNSNPFTMVHGDESEAELRTLMRVAFDAGFEGVTLHPYNYDDYLGPGQWQRWKIVLDEARRLGLIVWQQDDRNYPSGFAAGKVVAAHPEFARWTLREAAHEQLTGPKAGFQMDLGPLVPPGEQLVGISAYPSEGEPLDLTERAADGKLSWDVPSGTWELFVFKAAHERGHYANYIDFLSPQATDAYVEAIYGATFRELGDEFGRTFRGFFSDEAPVDFKLFTPDFLPRFEAAKGYSVRRWLPSLIHNLGPRDRQIRFDVRNFIREQVTTVFFGRSRQWCHEHGVQLIGHVIEDHQQDMRRLEGLDIPGADNVFGQWYDPDPDVYWRVARMASSVSHYNGVRNDLALMEHFAATGWRSGLSEMKRMMDWSTAFGFNQIVPCGLDSQMPPAWEVTPDFWLHGSNPQWPQFRDYQAAANRMTMLMRGGRHVAPAIVLDTTESQWVTRGVGLGTQHGATDDLWKTSAAMSQAQADFDLIPYYVFADGSRTTLAQDRLHIGKEDYRLVVLPGVEFVPAAVVERLLEFRDAGGLIVVLGRWPRASCNGQEDERVSAAIARLQAASARGKSLLCHDGELDACLAKLDVADVRLATPAPKLLYCHRQLHGKELYFFANTGAEPVATPVELRQARGVPSHWDPVTGEIAEVPGYTQQGDTLRLDLALGEYESFFLVVDPDGMPLGSKAGAAALQETVVPATWQVREGADVYHRIFSTEVTLPDAWPVDSPARLELRGASQILSVQVNGKTVGQRFCSPYRFEVGPQLYPGKNQIEVERIGRYSSPVAIPNIGPHSFTDDAKAVVPCQTVILVSPTTADRDSSGASR